MLNVYLSVTFLLVSIHGQTTENLENTFDLQTQFQNCSSCPIGYKLNKTDCNCTKCPSNTFGPNCDPCNVTCLFGECNQENGTCSCLEGYVGSTCTIPLCTSLICGPNGTCASPNQCLCDDTYTGIECRERYCPISWCAFGGTCRVTGVNESVEVVCDCIDDTFGPQCRSRFFREELNIIEEKTTQGKVSDIVLPIVLAIVILVLSAVAIVGLTYPYIRRKKAKARQSGANCDEDDTNKNSLQQPPPDQQLQASRESDLLSQESHLDTATRQLSLDMQPSSSHIHALSKDSLHQESNLVTADKQLHQDDNNMNVLEQDLLNQSTENLSSSPNTIDKQQNQQLQASYETDSMSQESNLDTANRQLSRVKQPSSSHIHALRKDSFDQEGNPDTADRQTHQDYNHMRVSTEDLLNQNDAEKKGSSPNTVDEQLQNQLYGSDSTSQESNGQLSHAKQPSLSNVHTLRKDSSHEESNPDTSDRQLLQDDNHMHVLAHDLLNQYSTEKKDSSPSDKQSPIQLLPLQEFDSTKDSLHQESSEITSASPDTEDRLSQPSSLQLSNSATNSFYRENKGNKSTSSDTAGGQLAQNRPNIHQLNESLHYSMRQASKRMEKKGSNYDPQQPHLSDRQSLEDDSLRQDNDRKAKGKLSDAPGRQQPQDQSLSASNIQVFMRDSQCQESKNELTSNPDAARDQQPLAQHPSSSHVLVVSKESLHQASARRRKKRGTSSHTAQEQQSRAHPFSSSHIMVILSGSSCQSITRRKKEAISSDAVHRRSLHNYDDYDDDDGEEPTPL